MPCILKQFNIAYFPAPKNACTSIIHLFFQLENGFDYRPISISGRVLWLHQLYDSNVPLEQQLRQTEGMQRITVIRDPLERFVSSYRNRVLHYREIEDADFDSDLTRKPTLNEFATGLAEYRKIPTIAHHTHPQAVFIGNDLSRYQHVYAFERVRELPTLIHELTGQRLLLRHDQQSDASVTIDKLTRESIDTLRHFYREDYAMLRGYYA